MTSAIPKCGRPASQRVLHEQNPSLVLPQSKSNPYICRRSAVNRVSSQHLFYDRRKRKNADSETISEERFSFPSRFGGSLQGQKEHGDQQPAALQNHGGNAAVEYQLLLPGAGSYHAPAADMCFLSRSGGANQARVKSCTTISCDTAPHAAITIIPSEACNNTSFHSTIFLLT